MCLSWWIHVWERCSFILTLPAHALEGQSRWRLPPARRNVLSFSLSSTAKGTRALFWSPEHQSMDSELPSTLRPALLHVHILYTPLVGPSNSWECESRGLLMPGIRKYWKCTVCEAVSRKLTSFLYYDFFPPLKAYTSVSVSSLSLTYVPLPQTTFWHRFPLTVSCWWMVSIFFFFPP